MAAPPAAEARVATFATLTPTETGAGACNEMEEGRGTGGAFGKLGRQLVPVLDTTGGEVAVAAAAVATSLGRPPFV